MKEKSRRDDVKVNKVCLLLWLFIFWLLPVCFYLRIVQYVSSGVLIWFILSGEMSHFAL